MMKKLSFLFCLILCSCTWQENSILPSLYSKKTYGNDQKQIILQHPTSRIVATCYNSDAVSTEECAQIFEKKGYVRLRDIPSKTANYDFLKTDTYPTRRWRDNEITPRW